MLHSIYAHTLSAIAKGVGLYKADTDEPSLSLIHDARVTSAWVIVDEALMAHPETERILAGLRSHTDPKRFLVTAVKGGEPAKSSFSFYNLTNEALDHFKYTPDALVAIGGGTILNLATFISATMEGDGVYFHPHKSYPQRGYANRVRELVLVPTTVLALADVAYGSKGNIDTLTADQHIACDIMRFAMGDGAPDAAHVGQKHGWKLYRDPDEIYIAPGYLQSLPAHLIKSGLSEVLKHALLQDDGTRSYRGAFRHSAQSDCAQYWQSGIWRTAPSLDVTLAQLKMKQPDPEICTDLALRTMYAKAAVLGVDPSEEKWAVAALLSYGHLHAHALEMASHYQLEHGEFVYIGMLIDLKLAGKEALYQKVLKVAANLPLTIHTLQIDEAELQAAYHREPKAFFKDAATGGFKVLPLEQAGQYARAGNAEEKIVPLGQIMAAFRAVLTDVTASQAVAPGIGLAGRARNLVRHLGWG